MSAELRHLVPADGIGEAGGGIKSSFRIAGDRPFSSPIINVQKKGKKVAQRGRKSTSALTVAAQVAPISSEQRLAPPLHISDAEREVWLRVVNDQPACAFSAVHEDQLVAYCRHVVRGDVLDEEIRNFERAWLADDDGLKRYKILLEMAERESRAASSMATRLRITRQATTDPKTVGRANANQSKARKPWELA